MHLSPERLAVVVERVLAAIDEHYEIRLGAPMRSFGLLPIRTLAVLSRRT